MMGGHYEGGHYGVENTRVDQRENIMICTKTVDGQRRA